MGIGEDEEFEHVAEAAWTVGQLRAALEGVADETALIAWVADEPGDQFVREQLVFNAGYGYPVLGDQVGFRGRHRQDLRRRSHPRLRHPATQNAAPRRRGAARRARLVSSYVPDGSGRAAADDL